MDENEKQQMFDDAKRQALEHPEVTAGIDKVGLARNVLDRLLNKRTESSGSASRGRSLRWIASSGRSKRFASVPA